MKYRIDSQEKGATMQQLAQKDNFYQKGTDNTDFILLAWQAYAANLHEKLVQARLNDLQTSYSNLQQDRYMNDGGKYRFRRFARLYFKPSNLEILRLPPAPFHQSKSLNSLNGGIERVFEEIEGPVLDNPLLHHLVRIQFLKIKKRYPKTDWLINLHQIRTISWQQNYGKPTPEGIHRDGHHFVGQILISKTNASGAESRLYNSQKELIYSSTLEKPLDSILLDDQEMYHEVTNLLPTDPMQPATRDMLLIDFNPTQRPHYSFLGN